MFACAAISAFLCWRSLRYTARTWREQQTNAARGISYKPDGKKSVGANVAVGLIAGCLLIVAVIAICKA